MTWLLLAMLQQAPNPDAYHVVTLRALATTRWTHVCVEAPVTYVRRQADGDAHVTLDDGRTKVVAEIISAVPLPAPRKGQRIVACGISRFDRHHGWAEVHPVLSWREVRP